MTKYMGRQSFCRQFANTTAKLYTEHLNQIDLS